MKSLNTQPLTVWSVFAKMKVWPEPSSRSLKVNVTLKIEMSNIFILIKKEHFLENVRCKKENRNPDFYVFCNKKGEILITHWPATILTFDPQPVIKALSQGLEPWTEVTLSGLEGK